MSSVGVPSVLMEGRNGRQLCARKSLVDCLDSPEDAEDLVNLRVAREQRTLHGHLCKDASYTPHINSCAVVP
jgi:hypothetical protein